MPQDALRTESQKLSPDALVELFELDTTVVGGLVYRFCSTTETGGATMIWQGNAFAPIDLSAEGFETNGTGTLPRPEITLSNVHMGASAILEAVGGDILGSRVTRWRTHHRFIDGQPDADPLAHYTADIYNVERKKDHNARFITFVLSASIDQEGVHLPKRRLQRDYCDHRYPVYNATTGTWDFSNATCPWTEMLNGVYIDRNGLTTDDPSKDACSKTRRTGCDPRFTHGVDPSQPLPARFCPGIGLLRRR